jgi:hypothetical protein
MAEPFNLETRRAIIGSFLARLPLVYCTPIYIGSLEAGDQQVYASGTATLLKIGGLPFIVTDDHALREYERRAVDNNSAFQIGTRPFDPMARLIDRSYQKDICVIDASGLDFNDRPSEASIPAIEFYTAELDAWPPKIAEAGDVVVLGGYPGAMREQAGLDVTSASFTIAAVEVTGSFPDYFTCNLDRTEWRAEGELGNSAVELRELGGMSGGPALRDGPGILSPILSGFIMEYEPTYDQLKMSHASLIKPDGRIVSGSLF